MQAALWFLLMALPLAAQLPQLPQDGEDHGDPPFMQEAGWRPLLNGRDLSGWTGENNQKHAWLTTRAVRWDKKQAPTALKGEAGPSETIMNSLAGKTANLVTTDTFGDAELWAEFLIPQGSNSGIYLHGLYEVQILDSFGKPEPLTTTDCGAIYHRWIEEKPVGGSAPLKNACRAPGQWQSVHVWFRGPRFDSDGKKTEKARFLRVLLNGVLIQQDVAVEGGTRSHINVPEARLNPLMLQGDHGPVAYRNLYIHALRELDPR